MTSVCEICLSIAYGNNCPNCDKEGRMTFYCVACKRATDAYDLWPNGECVCCYTATEDLIERDARIVITLR